jgi:hypothetical protein
MFNRSIVLIMSLLAGLAGCMSIPHRQVQIVVKDAETLESIAGASVEYALLRGETFVWRNNDSSKTGPDGATRQWVPVHFAVCSLTAPGYDPIYDYPEYLLKDKNAPTFYLFKLPKPVFRVVIPERYRGPVLMRWKESEKTGERVFIGAVDDAGLVQFEVPANMGVYDYAKMEIQLISAESGEPLDVEIQRFMRESDDGSRRVVYVGNRTEFWRWVLMTGFDFTWRKLDEMYDLTEMRRY